MPSPLTRPLRHYDGEPSASEVVRQPKLRLVSQSPSDVSGCPAADRTCISPTVPPDTPRTTQEARTKLALRSKYRCYPLRAAVSACAYRNPTSRCLMALRQETHRSLHAVANTPTPTGFRHVQVEVAVSRAERTWQQNSISTARDLSAITCAASFQRGTCCAMRVVSTMEMVCSSGITFGPSARGSETG